MPFSQDWADILLYLNGIKASLAVPSYLFNARVAISQPRDITSTVSTYCSTHKLSKGAIGALAPDLFWVIGDALVWGCIMALARVTLCHRWAQKKQDERP
ncbi:hypothetical protein [Aeromonas salmonicida]|uniref:hypothetical protein n=1 Tax=Aeromonas salmonicida TaxID=645 RepID=UPI00283A912E|nr:hypothetical protein [Aeromonas salmonicida]